MHPHLKSLLVKAGCEPTATDSQAQKFYDGMSADAKGSIDTQLDAMMTDDSNIGKTDEGDADSLAAKTAGTSAVSTQDSVTIATQAATAAIKQMSGPSGEAILAQEQARNASVTKIATLYKLSEDQTNAILSTGKSVSECRALILKEVEKRAVPLNSVKVGDDANQASLAAALPDALLLRAGMDVKVLEKAGKIHDRAVALSQRSTRSMVMSYLASLGATNVHDLSDGQLAKAMDQRGMRRAFPKLAALAETTSDFANITLDAQNKSLRAFYLDAERTWTIWAEKRFAPDFKNINSIALSEAPSMARRTEGGEVRYAYLSDSKETWVLQEYAVGVRLSRRLMINDDLQALTSLPRLHSNAAARLEDDVAYQVLTNNAAMADGGNLFNATVATTVGGHANYSASGAGPSVSTLQTGKTAMKKQKGLGGVSRLELDPKFLLVPTSIEEQTIEFIGSKTLIASQSSNGAAPTTVGDGNPFFNRYQVVGSTRLDDISATAWYLLADYRKGQVGTVQMAFLQDEPEPVIKQETDFDTDDLKSLCRHTVAAAAVDFRGQYKNNGA